LYVAAKFGHLHIIEWLLQTWDATKLEFDSALLAAAANGHYDVVHALIESHRDYVCDSGSYKSSIECAARGGAYSIVELLVDHAIEVSGASVVVMKALDYVLVSTSGADPVLWAALACVRDRVKELLKKL
jgi:ankyrin repeat protein